MAITNMTGKQYYAPKVKKDLKASNTLYDGQAKSTNKNYDTQVFEEGRAYEDQYRENAVQKAINERQVAESMANLGLRDSGLNRTQQTAVQLSYGNNKASIDRQRQASIDSLNFSRRQALDTIEQNRLATNTQIEQDYAEKASVYDENRQTEAKNLVLSFLEIGAEPPKDILALSGMSNSEVKAYKNYYKKAAQVTTTDVGGQPKNTGIINTDGSNLSDGMQGTLKENNVEMTAIVENGVATGYKYTDNKTGKSTTFSPGVNPFTGANNYDVYKAVASTADDFFENGYQPKKVYVGGKDYGYVSDSGIKGTINGNEQRVHKTSDGSLWIWDRNNNKYVKYQIKHTGLDIPENVSDNEWYSVFYKISQKNSKTATGEIFNKLRPFMSRQALSSVGQLIGRMQ